MTQTIGLPPFAPLMPKSGIRGSPSQTPLLFGAIRAVVQTFSPPPSQPKTVFASVAFTPPRI